MGKLRIDNNHNYDQAYIYDNTIFITLEDQPILLPVCLFILKCWVVFPLYTRSDPNQAVLVNNCFKPGAGMLGFKEAEEYFMMIEGFSSCEDINTLNRFPLNGELTFQTTFLLEIIAKNM